MRNIRRLPALLVLLCLVRGLAYAAFTPPWLAPDEPGHVAYARLLSEQGLPPRENETTVVVEQELLASLSRWRFWQRIGRPTPDPLPFSFLHDRDLIRQVGDEPPLYYLLPGLLGRAALSPEALLYLMRVTSTLLTTLTVVVVALSARELFLERPVLQAGIVALPALAPMVAYIGSSANNDTAAILVSTATLWLLLLGGHRGWTGRRAAALALLLVSALLAKKTALFLWVLVALESVAAAWRWLRLRSRWLRWSVLGGTAVVLAVCFIVAWLWRGPAAEGWAGSSAQSFVPRSSQAHSGSYAFWLSGSDTGERQRLVQPLLFSRVRPLRGQTVRLSAWVRSPQGDQPARLAIDDGVQVSLYPFTATPTWTRHELRHQVDTEPLALWVRLAPSTGDIGTAPLDLFFDDVSLVVEGAEGRELLVNGGAERGARQIEVWLARWLGFNLATVRSWLDPANYDRASLARYGLYVLLTFAGFWGNFGWLTRPVHGTWYGLWALLTVAAALGCLWLWWRERQQPRLAEWQRRGLRLLALALLLVLAQTFLPMIGRPWQPQGRYLFPALLPIATFLALGLRSWVSPQHRRRWLAAWLSLLLVFDQVCLWGYVLPLWR